MIRFTPNTITEWPALKEELRHVRRNNFAMDREEYQPGMICIGSAVRDHQGAVVAAVSASTSLARATDAHIKLICDEVVGTAQALSLELGEPSTPSSQ